jgi:hypothetical protein
MSTKLLQMVLSYRRTITAKPTIRTPMPVQRLQPFHHSTQSASKHSTPTSSPLRSPQPPENPTLPSFNLLHQIRNSRPAVRYTVYAGLGLMVTVESTFWLTVLKAKFWPTATEGEKEKADRVLENLRGAIQGVRGAWMGNYGRYFGGYVWGIGER